MKRCAVCPDWDSVKNQCRLTGEEPVIDESGNCAGTRRNK